MPRNTSLSSSPKWWLVICVATVIPVTAVFHHLVFYRPTCMLNPFGPDYNFQVVGMWLARDPSLPWAVVAMTLVYLAGLKFTDIRPLVAPVFVSFLPLSIWIWDIPFSNRIVCRNFHDGRVLLPGNLHLTTKYLYGLGIVLYIALAAWRLFRSRTAFAYRSSRATT